jgi:hypothetical protein
MMHDGMMSQICYNTYNNLNRTDLFHFLLHLEFWIIQSEVRATDSVILSESVKLPFLQSLLSTEYLSLDKQQFSGRDAAADSEGDHEGPHSLAGFNHRETSNSMRHDSFDMMLKHNIVTGGRAAVAPCHLESST